MNREKKETTRRRAEARSGLTEEEITRLDKEEIEEAELLRQAHALHACIFPEEYDHVYDISSERKMRRGGINPMSPETVEAARLFRAKLGFREPYSDYTLAGRETLDWVIAEIKSGKRAGLETLASNRTTGN